MTYPNPTSEVVTIESSQRLLHVTINHLDGRVVYQKYSLYGYHHTVDVSSLSAGLYIITVQEESGRVSTTKLIVQ